MQRKRYQFMTGLRINTDGTTIKDRKPMLEIKPNHRRILKRFGRIYNAHANGPAISDGNGWYR
jgi:hypothetical protein